jgi:hypothetical protein
MNNYREARCPDCGGLARPPRIIERVRDHPTERALDAAERALAKGGADAGLFVCVGCARVVRADVGEQR